MHAGSMKDTASPEWLPSIKAASLAACVSVSSAGSCARFRSRSPYVCISNADLFGWSRARCSQLRPAADVPKASRFCARNYGDVNSPFTKFGKAMPLTEERHRRVL